jgi:hypothetical protein
MFILLLHMEESESTPDMVLAICSWHMEKSGHREKWKREPQENPAL